MPLKPNTDNFQSIPVLSRGPTVRSFLFVLVILGISLKKPAEFIKEWFFSPYFLSASDILEDLGPFTFFKIILSCVLAGSPGVSERTWGPRTGIALGCLRPQGSVTSGLAEVALPNEGSFPHRLGRGLALGVPGCTLVGCDCSGARLPSPWGHTDQQPDENRERRCGESCPYPSFVHVRC